ncbi:hypothetical protein QZH41_003174 [Actinostola sp. cb2023]|nr:hypothetical protein QZH41_003174 [Actinostola sp. cb2023]
MATSVGVKENNIVWSGQEFKLSDFVEIYPPPQIVKVEEGYLDETADEERTVSSSQLLTLHAIEDFTTVRATDSNNLPISLPTTSSAKVEIVCEPSHYENVEQLVRDLPQFVSLEESHHWLDLDENDILEIKDKVKSCRNIHLRCLNLTKHRSVEFPLVYAARFKVLGECPVLRPTMANIVKYCKFPCVVRFIDDKLKVIHDGYNANFPLGLNSIGPLTLHSVAEHKVIFTTPWEDDRKDSVIPLPVDLEIRVVAALGAIQNDRNYSKLCKIVHSQTNSEKLVLKFIKDGEFKVLLEEKAVPLDEKNHDYSDVGPKVPSRLLKPGIGLPVEDPTLEMRSVLRRPQKAYWALQRMRPVSAAKIITEGSNYMAYQDKTSHVFLQKPC